MDRLATHLPACLSLEGRAGMFARARNCVAELGVGLA
jgi:hypothetical protein